MFRRLLVWLFLAAIVISSLPFTVQAYEISAEAIQQHVNILADDSLEGRQVGEPGEMKAALYIESVFRQAGLKPHGDNNSYLQGFEFTKAIDFGPRNRLTINGVELEVGNEYEPLKQSASGAFDIAAVVDVDFGIKTGDGQTDYNDYADKDVAGKAVLVRRYAPSSEENPHIDFSAYSGLTDKIRIAMEHKAAAVIFITPPNEDDTLPDFGSTNIDSKKIPLLLLHREGIARLGQSYESLSLVSLAGEIDLVRTRDTGFNVVGMIPGESDTTIIIGAHFDHLGWGGPNSLYRGAEPMIHNGADDNGSGTAALLELASYYGHTDDKKHYGLIFAAFSGEESGLLGSSHMAKAEDFEPDNVKMMLNMDMIGRLASQDNELAIMGTGTSEGFKNYFDSLTVEGLHIINKESGITPSDNTMFYNRGIPSLMFFTGAHQDYHRPTDDADLIDPEGIKTVALLVADIVDEFDEPTKPLEFSKTKDPEGSSGRRHFSVSLGVMPDYVAEVKGLKIDGVTPEKPAAAAGLAEGDIVIGLGEYPIGDIYEYMSALGKFRKGDSTTVTFVRDTDTLKVPIVF